MPDHARPNPTKPDKVPTKIQTGFGRALDGVPRQLMMTSMMSTQTVFWGFLFHLFYSTILKERNFVYLPFSKLSLSWLVLFVDMQYFQSVIECYVVRKYFDFLPFFLFLYFVNACKKSRFLPYNFLYFFFPPGQGDTIMRLNESALYTEDRLGLKQMNKEGRLHFLSSDSDHLRISDEMFDGIVEKFLRWKVLDTHSEDIHSEWNWKICGLSTFYLRFFWGWWRICVKMVMILPYSVISR